MRDCPRWALRDSPGLASVHVFARRQHARRDSSGTDQGRGGAGKKHRGHEQVGQHGAFDVPASTKMDSSGGTNMKVATTA
jgi:hypothetical protein